jgi:hypothetical protein
LGIFHASVREAAGQNNNIVVAPEVGCSGIVFNFLDISFKVFKFFGTEFNFGWFSDNSAPVRANFFKSDVTCNNSKKIAGDFNRLFKIAFFERFNNFLILIDSTHKAIEFFRYYHSTFKSRFN